MSLQITQGIFDNKSLATVREERKFFYFFGVHCHCEPLKY